MERFRVSYADGRTVDVDGYQAAINEVESRYPEAEIGHDGDLGEGGDRTLCWASESDAEGDDGQRSIASIRRAD